VLLASKRENNFIWTFERLRGIFFKSVAFPEIIVGDRDFALINPISIVFPEGSISVSH